MYVNSNKRSRNFCLKNSNCNITTETYETVYLFLIHVWIDLISGDNNSAIYIFPSYFRPLFWSTIKKTICLEGIKSFPSKFFPATADILEGLCQPEKQTGSHKTVVSLCKNSRKFCFFILGSKQEWQKNSNVSFKALYLCDNTSLLFA